MTTVNEVNGKYIVYTKGGVDELLKRSIAYLDNGEVKTDLDNYLDLSKLQDAFEATVFISAKNSVGHKELAEAVGNILGVGDFDTTAPLLANARQKQNCQRAYECVGEALDACYMGMTFDAINVMIDSAAEELLSLTGKKATEEVVNNIFSKFCVGK